MRSPLSLGGTTACLAAHPSPETTCHRLLEEPEEMSAASVTCYPVERKKKKKVERVLVWEEEEEEGDDAESFLKKKKSILTDRHGSIFPK